MIDDDPMLTGSPEQQSAYKDKIADAVRGFIKQDREQRQAANAEETPPVIIGSVGFGDGFKSIPR